MNAAARRIGRSLCLGTLLTAVCGVCDRVAGRATDWPLTLFLAMNAALSLMGLWYLVSRRSPWCSYWMPRMASEIGHWLFDLFWIYIAAFLGVLIAPYLTPVLVYAPPFVATILLANRLRGDRCPSTEPLRFWL